MELEQHFDESELSTCVRRVLLEYLRDLDGEAPTGIYEMIAVTCRCQCDCAHCSASGLSDNGAELSAGEIKKILLDARALGSPKAGFTGGEPLMRRDIAEPVVNHRHLFARCDAMLQSQPPLEFTDVDDARGGQRGGLFEHRKDSAPTP